MQPLQKPGHTIENALHNFHLSDPNLVKNPAEMARNQIAE
jgi:hypothetical protein